MRLSGKTVLITGGRRIGAHLANMLANRGANLAFSYFTSPDSLKVVADECQQIGVKTALFAADLRDPVAAQSLVDSTVEYFGTLDVLINLTSIYSPTPWSQLTPRDFDEAIASNLTAPYHTAIAAAKAMQRQSIQDGLQRKIIHFTDWAVERPYKGYLPYLVAKGGLVTLTKALAVELAPTITVNAIAPGTVEPPKDVSDEKLEQIRKSSLLKRTGSADDVNQAVMYLLEGSDFITGEVIRVDGGRFLGTTIGEA